MTLKEITFKNLLRRKAKAAFVLAGILVGVATVVAVVAFSEAMTADINHKLEEYGANILIVPRTDNLALSYGGMTLGGVSFEMKELSEVEIARVREIPNARNIAALGPMVIGGIDVKGRKALLAGVDFSAMRVLKPWWRTSGAQPVGESEALLGAEAARIMDLAAGEVIALPGGRLTVSGVLAPTGSQDDGLIFTRLKTAQRLLGKEGAVSMAEVAALCTDCPIDDMVAQISGVLPNAKVMAIQQVVKGRMETLGQFKKFSYGVSAVVALIGAMVVLIALMGSVRERTREIGIFRAVGFRRQHVMRMVLLEAATISLAAGVLGFAAGIGGALAGLKWFSSAHAIGIPLDWGLAAASIAAAVAVGLVASLYPAIMAARMDPNEALRAL